MTNLPQKPISGSLSKWQPMAMDQEWPIDMFNVRCTACPRLAAFLEESRQKYPDHFNAPVPPFGPPDAELVIVGLAPGLHGANKTGRPFTADFCSDLLYGTLHKYGFATKPVSLQVGDGQQLVNARVSNSVKCVPPQNKPLPVEIETCNHYISHEFKLYPPKAVLALGLVGHHAVLKLAGRKQKEFKFGHGAQHDLGTFRLFDSYHVSRYNTSTGRLTDSMFEAVLKSIHDYLKA